VVVDQRRRQRAQGAIAGPGKGQPRRIEFEPALRRGFLQEAPLFAGLGGQSR